MIREGESFSRSRCNRDELGLHAATLQSFHFQSVMDISDQQNKFSEGSSLCLGH